MKRAVLAVAIVFVAAALIVASVYQSRKRAAAISKNMAASTKWAQEPTAFMGIQFGHPIDESLPKCADLWRTGQPECYRSFSTNPNNYLIYGVDGYTVGAEAINGKIEAVYAFFPSSDADRIGRALIAKYGTGYKEKTDDVTT